MNRRILVTALVVSALVGLGSFILIKNAPVHQSFRMADGTVVRFNGITCSPSNQIVQGTEYQKILRALLPAKYKSWSGCQVYGYYNGNTNIPVFWMSFSKPGATAPPVRLLDEYGCEHDPEAYGKGTVLKYAFYFINGLVPGGRTAGLCFYDNDRRTNKIGQFLIPGAPRTPVPVSRNLPAPQTAGDLTVRLTGLTTGLTSIPMASLMSTNPFPFTQAAFTITRDGQRVNDWRPIRIRITGPDGKGVPATIFHPAFRGDEFILNFDTVLDPARGPFKLEVQIRQESGFTSDELVTLAHVPFPRIGESLKPGAKAEIHGETVAIDEVHGANGERSWPQFPSTEAFVAASVSPAERGLWLQLIRAVNEQGEEMPLAGAALMGTGTVYSAFQPNAYANFMDLTFAVHRSRYVTFAATPVWFSTNPTPRQPPSPAH